MNLKNTDSEMNLFGEALSELRAENPFRIFKNYI